jgi:hypothetical protein
MASESLTFDLKSWRLRPEYPFCRHHMRSHAIGIASWAMRLQHVRMARSGLVRGMPSSLTDVSFTLTCSACAYGKQSHRPFVRHGAPESLSIRNVEYSETVESPAHSAGGAKYAGTFTDAKTRYTAVSGLAKNRDVAVAARHVLAQWAVNQENTAQERRSAERPCHHWCSSRNRHQRPNLPRHRRYPMTLMHILRLRSTSSLLTIASASQKMWQQIL